MKKIALSALVIAASGAYVWSQAGATSDPLLADADIQTGSVQAQTLTSTGAHERGAARGALRDARNGSACRAARRHRPSPLRRPPPAQPLPPLPDPSGFAPAASDTQSPVDAAPTPTAPVVVAETQPPAAPADPAPAPADTAAITVPMPRLRPPYHQVAAAAPTPAPASAPSSTPDPAAPASPLVRIAASTSGLTDGTYRGPVVDAYYGLMQIEAVVQNGRLVTIKVLQYPTDRRTSVYINRQALPMLRDEVISAQSANVDIISGATLTSEAFIQSLDARARQGARVVGSHARHADSDGHADHGRDRRRRRRTAPRSRRSSPISTRSTGASAPTRTTARSRRSTRAASAKRTTAPRCARCWRSPSRRGARPTAISTSARADGTLDPSGIVKGWAIRNAAALVARSGARDFYVDAGGDIQASGQNADGKDVARRHPQSLRCRPRSSRSSTRAARGIATSGTYVRGQHIYDPHARGTPIDDIVSLTVIGPDVLEADRFATAAFAMGRDGIGFIEQTPGLEGYVVDRNGRATLTSGFEGYCAP